MARDMDNPDRRGKDMDMSDVREGDYYCLDCGRHEDDDHAEGCRYAADE